MTEPKEHTTMTTPTPAPAEQAEANEVPCTCCGIPTAPNVFGAPRCHRCIGSVLR